MKKFLAPILLRLGCKDISVMRYGLTHFNLKLLVDGIFYGKYMLLIRDENTLNIARKYGEYLGNRKYHDDLIEGLDKESVNIVNGIENVVKALLNGDEAYINNGSYIINRNMYKIGKVVNEYIKDIYLPVEQKEISVFYYKHGIDSINNLKSRLKGKDIIDCGAFIGDSAMMFSKEIGFESDGGGVRCIYCLEPDLLNKKLLEKTIDKNNMKGKIIPLSLGVGKRKDIAYINHNGSGSMVVKKDKFSSVINIDTLDNIVEEYHINPGMIKWDIEGLEYDSIIGVEKTIRSYKPILLISIYHNGRDFYEIKPLIESRNLGYKFLVRHLSDHPIFETMLICY